MAECKVPEIPKLKEKTDKSKNEIKVPVEGTILADNTLVDDTPATKTQDVPAPKTHPESATDYEMHPELKETLENAVGRLQYDSVNLDDLPMGPVISKVLADKLTAVNHIAELSMANCNLKDLAGLPVMENVDNLVLSDNQINYDGLLGLLKKSEEVKTKEAAGQTPTTVPDDSSSERSKIIPETDVLVKFPSVKVLNVSNNQIGEESSDSLKEVLHVLQKAFPKLHTLDMESNPVCKARDYRPTTFSNLPNLKILDKHNEKNQRDVADYHDEGEDSDESPIDTEGQNFPIVPNIQDKVQPDAEQDDQDEQEDEEEGMERAKSEPDQSDVKPKLEPGDEDRDDTQSAAPAPPVPKRKKRDSKNNQSECLGKRQTPTDDDTNEPEGNENQQPSTEQKVRPPRKLAKK